tara:strand:- start:161 stop:709 length:549 start_codon:yes stop_codon:yes gene_type:complete
MITADELRSFVNYNPDTGEFTWNQRDPSLFKTNRAASIWNAQFPGKTAGGKQSSDSGKGLHYWVIVIFRKKYLAHRLAWLYMTGDWPVDQLDHINGDSLDNQWSNLREVSNAENGRNCKVNVNNTSGVMGVYFYKRDQIWCAYITKNYKTKSLGRFEDWFDAVCARKSAEVKLGFHANHGGR